MMMMSGAGHQEGDGLDDVAHREEVASGMGYHGELARTTSKKNRARKVDVRTRPKRRMRVRRT